MTYLEVTAYTGLGPGPHDVVVTGVERKIAKAGGDYLRWEFADTDGRTASANTSMEMTPGNKTGKWFAALTGRVTEVGQKRDLGEVIGKPAAIFIELNQEGYPKVISVTARQSSTKTQTPTVEAIQKAEAQAAPTGKGTDNADDDLPF